MVGDRIGRYRNIWISIVGPLPFTLLLPSADLSSTVVLTIVINLLMASGFPSSMIYAIDLVPNRIGPTGGFFYGLNFAIGGIAAAYLHFLSDGIGIEGVYRTCSLLPVVGVLTILLPRPPARCPSVKPRIDLPHRPVVQSRSSRIGASTTCIAPRAVRGLK